MVSTQILPCRHTFMHRLFFPLFVQSLTYFSCIPPFFLWLHSGSPETLQLKVSTVLCVCDEFFLFVCFVTGFRFFTFAGETLLHLKFVSKTLNKKFLAFVLLIHVPAGIASVTTFFLSHSVLCVVQLKATLGSTQDILYLCWKTFCSRK